MYDDYDIPQEPTALSQELYKFINEDNENIFQWCNQCKELKSIYHQCDNSVYQSQEAFNESSQGGRSQNKVSDSNELPEELTVFPWSTDYVFDDGDFETLLPQNSTLRNPLFGLFGKAPREASSAPDFQKSEGETSETSQGDWPQNNALDFHGLHDSRPPDRSKQGKSESETSGSGILGGLGAVPATQRNQDISSPLNADDIGDYLDSSDSSEKEESGESKERHELTEEFGMSLHQNTIESYSHRLGAIPPGASSAPNTPDNSKTPDSLKVLLRAPSQTLPAIYIKSGIDPNKTNPIKYTVFDSEEPDDVRSSDDRSKRNGIYLRNVGLHKKDYSKIDENNPIDWSCAFDSILVGILNSIEHLSPEDRDPLLEVDGETNPLSELCGLDKLSYGLKWDNNNVHSVIGYPLTPDGRHNLLENSFYCEELTIPKETGNLTADDVLAKNIGKGRNYFGVLLKLVRYYYSLRKYCLEEIEKAIADRSSDVNSAAGFKKTMSELSETKQLHLKHFHLVRYFSIYYYSLNLYSELYVRHYREHPPNEHLVDPRRTYGTYKPPVFKADASSAAQLGDKAQLCDAGQLTPQFYPMVTCVYSKSFYEKPHITPQMYDKIELFSTRSEIRSMGFVDDIFHNRMTIKKPNDEGSFVKMNRIYTMYDGGFDEYVTETDQPVRKEVLESTYYLATLDVMEKSEIICCVSSGIMEHYVLKRTEKLGKIFNYVNDIAPTGVYYWSMEDLVHPITGHKYRPVSVLVVGLDHFVTLIRNPRTENEEPHSDHWSVYDDMNDGLDKESMKYYCQTTLLNKNPEYRIYKKNTEANKAFTTERGKEKYGETKNVQLVLEFRNPAKHSVKSITYVRVDD